MDYPYADRRTGLGIEDALLPWFCNQLLGSLEYEITAAEQCRTLLLAQQLADRLLQRFSLVAAQPLEERARIAIGAIWLSTGQETQPCKMAEPR